MIALVLLAAAAPAGPLDLASRVLVERRVAARDGTVSIEQVPAKGAAPGDRLIVQLTDRNSGTQPLGDLLLGNPVPAGMAYRGPAAAGPEPEVSADGQRFAPLARLTVAGPAGARAATAADVTHVRWRLTRPLQPGAGGSLSFRAIVK